MISAQFRCCSRLVLALMFVLASVLPSPAAFAAEGGSSLYIPGAYGDFGLGTLPEQAGFYLDENLYRIDLEVDRTVLQGRVNLGLETGIWLNFLSLSYVSGVELLGGRYGASLAIPVASADLDARVDRPAGSVRVRDDNTGLGDVIVIPWILAWKRGELSLQWNEGVVVPIGKYDVNDAVNLGRNYWAVDSNFAINWLHAKRGLELAANLGLMVNGENDDTDYETGNEFHLDVVVNQYFSKTFAVGLQGYVYDQVTGDSGDGAVLGEFKGSSSGVGPAIFWVTQLGKRPVAFNLKWLHDLTAKRRLEGDYVQLGVAFKL